MNFSSEKILYESISIAKSVLGNALYAAHTSKYVIINTANAAFNAFFIRTSYGIAHTEIAKFGEYKFAYRITVPSFAAASPFANAEYKAACDARSTAYKLAESTFKLDEASAKSAFKAAINAAFETANATHDTVEMNIIAKMKESFCLSQSIADATDANKVVAKSAYYDAIKKIKDIESVIITERINLNIAYNSSYDEFNASNTSINAMKDSAKETFSKSDYSIAIATIETNLNKANNDKIIAYDAADTTYDAAIFVANATLNKALHVVNASNADFSEVENKCNSCENTARVSYNTIVNSIVNSNKSDKVKDKTKAIAKGAYFAVVKSKLKDFEAARDINSAAKDIY
ncbi:MAG: hypothetical protein NTW06_03770, partial [Candidatus Falkowbacteria bacterium]|nr:hypothetical protein [Candidatus Falkowbacteria bacterium]